MSLPAGWSFSGNQPLRLLPDLFGLPTRYAALLATVSLLTAVQFHYVWAGAFIAIVGVGLGRAVVWFDPFGWEIMAKNLTLPRRLLP
jgi:hypothetical protein